MTNGFWHRKALCSICDQFVYFPSTNEINQTCENLMVDVSSISSGSDTKERVQFHVYGDVVSKTNNERYARSAILRIKMFQPRELLFFYC